MMIWFQWMTSRMTHMIQTIWLLMAIVWMSPAVWAQDDLSSPTSSETSVRSAGDEPIQTETKMPETISGQALTQRLTQVIDQAQYPYEQGYRIANAAITPADLQVSWAAMPPPVRDGLIQSFETGRTLLIMQTDQEQLLAIALMRFQTVDEVDAKQAAADFVTAAHAMSQTQFAESQITSGQSSEQSSEQTTNEVSGQKNSQQDPQAIVYSQLTQKIVAYEGKPSIAQTQVTMQVPGSPKASVRLYRASNQQLACEVLAINGVVQEDELTQWVLDLIEPMTLNQEANSDSESD